MVKDASVENNWCANSIFGFLFDLLKFLTVCLLSQNYVMFIDVEVKFVNKIFKRFIKFKLYKFFYNLSRLDVLT